MTKSKQKNRSSSELHANILNIAQIIGVVNLFQQPGTRKSFKKLELETQLKLTNQVSIHDLNVYHMYMNRRKRLQNAILGLIRITSYSIPLIQYNR